MSSLQNNFFSETQAYYHELPIIEGRTRGTFWLGSQIGFLWGFFIISLGLHLSISAGYYQVSR